MQDKETASGEPTEAELEEARALVREWVRHIGDPYAGAYGYISTYVLSAAADGNQGRRSAAMGRAVEEWSAATRDTDPGQMRRAVAMIRAVEEWSAAIYDTARAQRAERRQASATAEAERLATAEAVTAERFGVDDIARLRGLTGGKVLDARRINPDDVTWRGGPR